MVAARRPPPSGLLLVLAACLFAGGYAGGAYVHAPWFGEESIFGPSSVLHERNLGFSSLSFAAKALAPALSVSVLAESGTIQATWSNVEHPTAKDVLVLTCSDQPEWSLNEGFDAVLATPLGHKVESSGSRLLPNRTILPDLRCQYVVRYVRSDGKNIGSIVAEAKLHQEFGLRPKQVHLAFTQAHSEMLVTWVSGHESPAPQVRWSTAKGGPYTQVNNGTSSTYKALDMCNAPANTTGPTKFIDPGYFHRVVVTNLPAATTIYYVVGNGVHGWSEETSFRSRLLPTADAVKFIMYADQALPVPLFEKAWRMTKQVVNDINAGYNGFLLHPGDLGYAEGSGAVWDVWGGLVESITSRVAYEVTVGNHEYDHVGLKRESSGAPPGGWHPQNGKSPEPWGNMGDDSQGECGVPTVARFNGTGNGNGVFWYSFNEGGIHVIQLSSEHDWRLGSRQYTWLAQDLQAVNRKVTPWIVLATHRMMYTTQLDETDDYKVSLGFRENVEPLLKKYKVNLMLVGHQHSYERSCPVYNDTCVPDRVSGTTHMVVGSAGATREKGGFSPKFGNFSEKHLDDYGYIRVDANRTRLHVDFVRTNKHDHIPAGQVWDSVDILPWP